MWIWKVFEIFFEYIIQKKTRNTHKSSSQLLGQYNRNVALIYALKWFISLIFSHLLLRSYFSYVLDNHSYHWAKFSCKYVCPYRLLDRYFATYSMPNTYFSLYSHIFRCHDKRKTLIFVSDIIARSNSNVLWYLWDLLNPSWNVFPSISFLVKYAKLTAIAHWILSEISKRTMIIL